MRYSLYDYLFSPYLWMCSWGCLFLGMTSGLLGVLLLFRSATLQAEVMSHASYPGLMLATLLLAWMGPTLHGYQDLCLYAGAGGSALLGIVLYSQWVKRGFSSDSTLCWTLASFLGVGVLLASFLQGYAPSLYQCAQYALYGQAATLLYQHVILFFFLLVAVGLTLIVFWRPILCETCDPLMAQVQGFSSPYLTGWLLLLTTALLVTGVRAAGVLVISALLVAPAISARMLTRELRLCVVVSALLGGGIALLGHILSLEVSFASTESCWGSFERGGAFLPTGSAIALVGATCSLLVVGWSYLGSKACLLWRHIRFRPQGGR